jgi:EpsI family protein
MGNWYRVTISCALLLGAYLFLQFRPAGVVVPLRQPFSVFPDLIKNWQEAEALAFDEQALNTLKVKDYLLRRYVNLSGRSLWLYIGYWDTQRKGAQMHSPKHCLPGAGWEPVDAQRVSIPLREPPGAIIVNRYLVQKDQDQLLVLYWYQSGGQTVAGEFGAKLQLVTNSIFRGRTDGALIRTLSPIYGSVQETFDLHVNYIQAVYPILRQFLPD